MLLFLTAIDQQGQNRDFSCQLNKIGQVVDLLNHIVDRGSTLLMAYILEKDTKTYLPLDAFDRHALDQLEAEWQSVLTHLPEPDLADSVHKESIRWTKQRIKQCETQISSLERMVSRFGELKNRSQACATASVSHHFASLLAKYEQQLINAHRFHQAALFRLQQLSS